MISLLGKICSFSILVGDITTAKKLAYECMRLFKLLYDKSDSRFYHPMYTLSIIFYNAKDYNISLEYLD